MKNKIVFAQQATVGKFYLSVPKNVLVSVLSIDKERVTLRLEVGSYHQTFKVKPETLLREKGGK